MKYKIVQAKYNKVQKNACKVANYSRFAFSMSNIFFLDDYGESCTTSGTKACNANKAYTCTGSTCQCVANHIYYATQAECIFTSGKVEY